MQVCIIGCGASGLSAIRRCREYNLQCTAFEVTGDIGGIWVCTEETDKDEFGLPILSGMYKSLRTNLPRELMEFPGFKFEYYTDTGYPHCEEVYRYLHKYADYLDLWPNIKFYHHVESVKRIENQWVVQVKSLKDNETLIYNFDAVIVANGHNSVPFVPEIVGIETFEGLALHSHCYRYPKTFENKKVLIIGSGPSGMDIVFEFGHITEKTFFSHHNPNLLKYEFPDNVIHKPDVSLIRESQVQFVDGTVATVDAIIYCTGYKYSFPFLDETCGIRLEENRYVSPTYKGFINIAEPTMCFMCLQQQTIIFLLVDTQAHVFAKILAGQIRLPSKIEMLKYLSNDKQLRINKGIPLKKFNYLGEAYVDTVESYIRDLENFGQMSDRIPEVIFKIYETNRRYVSSEYVNLRNLKYRIIDERCFSLQLKR